MGLKEEHPPEDDRKDVSHNTQGLRGTQSTHHKEAVTQAAWVPARDS